MKTLYPDQDECIRDIHANGWMAGYQRVLAQKPTGTGKTVIFTAMARDFAIQGLRVLVLVDAEELVDQTMRTMAEDMPGVHVGVVQAGRNHATAQVIVASKQTLDRKARLRAIGRIDVIIIDEAHMAAAQGYISIVHALGGFDPASGVRVVGLTATADRTGDLALGDMWEVVAYNQPVEEAFRLGRLVRPTFLPVGDVRTDDPHAVVRDVLSRPELKPWDQGVVYARTVKHARQIRDAFRRAGETAELVYDDIASAERKRIYDATRRRSNRWLINVNVLVKGFDMPQLTVAVILRKMSQVPYVQSVGRVLRTADGKTYALVLDYAQNRHSLQVVPNIAPSIDGKREKAILAAAGRKAAPPVRKAPPVEYKVFLRTPRIGRKHVRVVRVERTGSTQVAKIYGHPVHRLYALAEEAVEADKRARAEVLRERIRALGGGHLLGH